MTLKKQSILILIFSLSLTTIYAKNEVLEKQIVYSMKHGVFEVKKLLKKVSIYKIFEEDKTLLHYAVEEGNYKIVEFLVNQNIYLSQKGGDFYGTALQEAIFYHHIEIAIFLIEQGTLVNEQNINGDTALHLAANNGDLVLIETLISHGASKYILNNNGKTPLDLIPDLTWDDNREMKRILSSKEKTNFKSKIKNVNTYKDKTKIINQINPNSTIINSTVGIKIN